MVLVRLGSLQKSYAGTVLAGELSLIGALAAGHLGKGT